MGHRLVGVLRISLELTRTLRAALHFPASETLEGPVFLRSSCHKLPALVVALRSPKVGVKPRRLHRLVKGERIRNTLEAVPDQPGEAW